jgi:hypothetical protein
VGGLSGVAVSISAIEGVRVAAGVRRQCGKAGEGGIYLGRGWPTGGAEGEVVGSDRPNQSRRGGAGRGHVAGGGGGRVLLPHATSRGVG